MKPFFITCLVLTILFMVLPASAFVDRNDVTSAAQFSDYVPDSYLKKAGVTNDMTVAQALDAYITYALSFSDKTSYAYISAISSPAQVKVIAGGSTAAASRGDAVPAGSELEVGNGASAVIRYPGGVTHTIKGPYTYTVPAYGTWGKTATFGGTTTSPAAPAMPDTAGYATITKEIDCRGMHDLNVISVWKVSGTVYAVHYSLDPGNPAYPARQIPAGGSANLGDSVSIVTGPGSSAIVQVTGELDPRVIPEKTVFQLKPRINNCVADTDWAGVPTGTYHEKNFLESIFIPIFRAYNDAQNAAYHFYKPIEKIPTTVAGVRG